MSLFAVRDGKLKYINKTNCPNITVMADWASKANYNNPLFTIYHTLQFAKHKYNTFDERLIWFDGVEGKRGLTSTSLSFLGGGGRGEPGGGVKLFHCIVRTGVYDILCA